MRSSNYNTLEINQETTSLVSFMESYNESTPRSFPQASVETLKQFQETNPSLFQNKNEWSIDKHRKRFMDWRSSH